jgi:hypothetical protein
MLLGALRKVFRHGFSAVHSDRHKLYIVFIRVRGRAAATTAKAAGQTSKKIIATSRRNKRNQENKKGCEKAMSERAHR